MKRTILTLTAAVLIAGCGGPPEPAEPVRVDGRLPSDGSVYTFKVDGRDCIALDISRGGDIFRGGGLSCDWSSR